jgi:hypothetical protein
MQMEFRYPADWIFLTPEESIHYGYQGDKPLGMDVILDLVDGRAGPHRFFTGGTDILEATFRADILLGPEFEGKHLIQQYSRLPYTCLAEFSPFTQSCISQYPYSLQQKSLSLADA